MNGELSQPKQVLVTQQALDSDVKSQPVRIADVLVFGPLMIYSGLGKATPKWVRTGMVLIGVGTIVYNLVNYFEIEKRKRGTATLEGMNWGPMHKAQAEFHRPINLLRQVRPR